MRLRLLHALYHFLVCESKATASIVDRTHYGLTVFTRGRARGRRPSAPPTITSLPRSERAVDGHAVCPQLASYLAAPPWRLAPSSPVAPSSTTCMRQIWCAAFPSASSLLRCNTLMCRPSADGAASPVRGARGSARLRGGNLVRRCEAWLRLQDWASWTRLLPRPEAKEMTRRRVAASRRVVWR